MSTCCSATSVRMSKAAPTTSTSAIAISAMTSIARILPEPVTSRPPSRRPAFRCTRAVAAAGATPERLPSTSVTSAVNASTSPSTRTSWSRGADGGAMASRPCHAPPRQEEAGDAAGDGEQRAFRQQLAHDLAAAGAERRADRDLTAAIGRARQQQAHHVRAGDARGRARRRGQERAASGGCCRPDLRAAE